MSFHYAGTAFEQSRPLHTLVLMGMGNRVQASAARPLAQCRSALQHARRNGLPVCFLHEPRPHAGGWIQGLAPTRHDRLFLRRGPSCFDSLYFAEAASGILALAGFLTVDAIRATARDAIRHARTIIVLEDAIVPPANSTGLAQECLKSPSAGIRSCQTRCWIETTNQYGKA